MKIMFGNKAQKWQGRIPVFLLAVHRKHGGNNFFRIGRLYRGYVGIVLTVKNLFSLDVWFYNMQARQ